MRLGSLILAGGRSRRMGRPKESLPFGGTTLLAHVAAALRACTDPVLVVARGLDQELPALPDEVLVATDERPDGGPLWGLLTGLREVRARGLLGDRDAVFATGCDAPFPNAAVVAALAEALGDREVALFRVAGVLQPLCAVYRVGVAARAAGLVAAGARSLQELVLAADRRELGEAELDRLDPGRRCVADLDTPADYERARRGPS